MATNHSPSRDRRCVRCGAVFQFYARKSRTVRHDDACPDCRPFINDYEKVRDSFRPHRDQNNQQQAPQHRRLFGLSAGAA